MVVFKEAGNANAPQPHAFVEVPSIVPRLVPINSDNPGHHFILLEDLIRNHIQVLFPGMQIKNTIALTGHPKS